MATTFKTFANNDKTATRTLLHEAIPLTGTIVSGTYNAENIKNYSHAMFTSVYDYPYLSSSANHIMDITYGFSAASEWSGSTTVQQEKKMNIYNQMAQVLAGYDVDGNIRAFDRNGNYGESGDDKINDAIFINFSRLLTKDEIKKGSFSMTFLTGGAAAAPHIPATAGKMGIMTIGDSFTDAGTAANSVDATTNYRVNSPAGEFGILYTKASGTAGHFSRGDNVTTGDGAFRDGGVPCGLIYYQAGIAVLTASMFGYFHVPGNSAASVNNAGEYSGLGNADKDLASFQTGSNITGITSGFMHRLNNISFNNTTELNSTIHFCRAHHNEFNYSANPTYLSDSQLVVKDKAEDTPVSYITTIGLYAPDNELLAVAKLSEPIKKDPTTELTFRVRLDY